MVKKLLVVTSILLVVVHTFILYFWVFDYEKIATGIGLIVWIGSFLFGTMIYLFYRKFPITERSIIFSKKIVFSSTLMAALLGVFALIIELIVRSMP